MKKQARRCSGFTLIEITLAVGIMALVVCVGYAALAQMMGTKKLLDDRRDTAAVTNALMGRFIRELQLASSITGLLPPQDAPESRYPARTYLVGENNPGLEGKDADQITFVALEGGQYLPDGGTHTGLVQISYRLAEDPEKPGRQDSFILIREETPIIRPLERAYKHSMVFPIAENVLSLSFSYYDVDEQNWSKTWIPGKKSGLPGLVRFMFRLRSQQGVVTEVGTTVPIRGAGRNSS